MVDEDCTHCVMEVSSHGLALHRTFGLDFDTAVFTNLTSDHLDFHKDFDHYLSAKQILFNNLKENVYAVYNADDAYSEKILENCVAEKVSYGAKENSDFGIADISYGFDGTNFSMFYQNAEYKVTTSLIGAFNAYNAVSAIASAVFNGIDINDAVKGIENTPQVPGRFEVITKGNKKVIIDYSHTADSLEKALESIHHLNHEKRQIVTVFGCGGDRDSSKRPIMGEIAGRLSDIAIVTSDNPRTENPFKIIDEILKGMKENNYRVIENRENAIKKAIEDSNDDAVVLIAGKGHETYQEINGVRHHFSDKEKAEKFLGL
jgi:UDP-N-acetylmuramoyl-L-alanyl-D-glutamate--2,6-diaminopimelate ligase